MPKYITFPQVKDNLIMLLTLAMVDTRSIILVVLILNFLSRADSVMAVSEETNFASQRVRPMTSVQTFSFSRKLVIFRL